MKVHINNSKLLEALGHIQSIVEKKTTRHILSNVKISTHKNQITLFTTNLDLFAKESIDAIVQGQFTTTVPSHVFYEIIKKIGNGKEVQLIFEPSPNPLTMLIVTGLSQFRLPCLPDNEFPNFEEGEHSCEFKIRSDYLYYLISKTKHAISSDETRYYLNGVLLHVTKNKNANILRAVTTDVHRLAIGEVVLPNNAHLLPDIILPKKTVLELLKLLENFIGNIEVGVSSNKITLKIANTTLISKLIDGKFPDYIKAVPYNNKTILKISVSELIKALDLVTTVSTEKIITVKLHLQRNKVILSVSHKINSFAKIEVPSIYNGNDMIIAFNPKYIIDILTNLKSDTAYFKLKSSSTAALVEDSSDDNCRFILMPMQV